MPNLQPEQALKNQNSSRSLGIALGATEIIFLLGLCFLATGSWLVFGGPVTVLVVGAVLVVTAWLMQFAN